MEDFIKDLDHYINFNGSRSFNLITLIKKEYPKAKNVSEKRIKVVKDILTNKGFFTYPILENNLTGDCRILITKTENRRSLKSFRTEKEFQNLILEKKLFKNFFGLEDLLDQHKLRGARDIVDFVGVKNDSIHIIEIKKESSYYGVEQLMRYSGILKKNKDLTDYIIKNNWKPDFNMILITSVEDPKLHHVFSGMVKEQRKHFQWFIYNYDGEETLEFIEIDINKA